MKGNKTSKRSFRIVTNEDLPFKPNDKIILESTSKTFIIDKVTKDKSVTNNMVAGLFPFENYYQPTVIDMR